MRPLAVALAAVLACAVRPASPEQNGGGGRIVGYLASWGVGDKDTRIAELPGERLTHIIYAFARITGSGGVALADPCADAGECAAGASGPAGGNFAQLRRLKERYPRLRLLMALGGWTGSGRFSDVALTPESRRVFASSAVDVVIRRHPGLFDGIDIDWEYPVGGGLPENRTRPEDRRNYTLLLAELRRQLDAAGARDGRRYLLTAATPAGPTHVANFELDRVTPLVDWFNVMTYDYHAGSREAHFNAPLYPPPGDPTPQLTVDATVRLYRERGVPPEKIVVGVPFYARSYGRVPRANRGLFQSAGAPAPRAWGEVDFDELMRKRPEASGFRRYWEPTARVPWLYNESAGTWITYDDVHSIAEKADYVRTHRLGGVMIWELGGDDSGLLVRTISEHLAARTR
jgi:chitinase